MGSSPKNLVSFKGRPPAGVRPLSSNPNRQRQFRRDTNSASRSARPMNQSTSSASFDNSQQRSPSKAKSDFRRGQMQPQNLPTMNSQNRPSRAQTAQSPQHKPQNQNPFPEPNNENPDEDGQNEEGQDEEEQDETQGSNDDQEENNQENDPVAKLKVAAEQFRAIQGSKMSRLKQGMGLMRQMNAMQAASKKEAEKTQLSKRDEDLIIVNLMEFTFTQMLSSTKLAFPGVGSLLTLVPDFILLLWKNVKMIYGRWMMKGKHKIIPPIKYTFPDFLNKIETGAILPQIFLIMQNCLFILTLMLPFIFIAAVIGLVAALPEIISDALKL